jgi:hypothetical protein
MRTIWSLLLFATISMVAMVAMVATHGPARLASAGDRASTRTHVIQLLETEGCENRATGKLDGVTPATPYRSS